MTIKFSSHRTGKTHAQRALVSELRAAGERVVVIDVTSSWRASSCNEANPGKASP